MCPSSPCASMPGRNVAHAVDDAPEVHAEHPLPVGLSRLPRQPARADAGVVAEDVHAAERVDRRALAAPRSRSSLRVSALHGDAPSAPRSAASPRPRAVAPLRRRRGRRACLRRRSARPAPRPMPLAAPVTTAVLPLKSCIFASCSARANCDDRFADNCPSNRCLASYRGCASKNSQISSVASISYVVAPSRGTSIAPGHV